jgi:hypothetical protein
MTYTKFGALVASVGVMAFALVPYEASARPGASRGSVVAARPFARPFAAHSFRHRRGSVFLPGIVGGDFYAPSGAPVAEVTAPLSADVHYTYTYDVPWDWAHRFPPQVAPSDRPYAPGCTAEPVTVPGHDGGEHVVNVTRCY